MLSRQVSEGVAQAGYSIKASHGAVFGQLTDDGSRLTDLARGANMTPQAMGELVDELEGLGYVMRTPDPTDRRAKLIQLTASGRRCVATGIDTITALERRITNTLGERRPSRASAHADQHARARLNGPGRKPWRCAETFPRRITHTACRYQPVPEDVPRPHLIDAWTAVAASLLSSSATGSQTANPLGGPETEPDMVG
jgi:DNA-binding MarR family transcriptional regulator